MEQLMKKLHGANIDHELSEPGCALTISSIIINFDTQPTTSENVLVTIDNQKSDFNATIHSYDPSSGTLGKVFIDWNDAPKRIPKGWSLHVKYANTDNRFVSVAVFYNVI